MTPEEILRDRLRGVFKLLEMANVEAMRTKRQAELIASADPPGGGVVNLFPCRFHIDGHTYGAMVTQEQQDLILTTIGKGTAGDVLKLIAENFLMGHLYVAVELVSALLVAAVKNESLPALPKAHGKAHAGKAGGIQPVGACKFSNGDCQQPCGAPLCRTLGGTPCEVCERPDDDGNDAGH